MALSSDSFRNSSIHQCRELLRTSQRRHWDCFQEDWRHGSSDHRNGPRRNYSGSPYDKMAKEVAAILKETMIEAGKTYLGRVPVEVELTIGETWAEK